MILNGKTVDLKEDISVEQLLKDYDLNPQKVVVEVNMEILDDEVYSTYLLKNEDTVEVISFVGGGWFEDILKWDSDRNRGKLHSL